MPPSFKCRRRLPLQSAVRRANGVLLRRQPLVFLRSSATAAAAAVAAAAAASLCVSDIMGAIAEGKRALASGVRSRKGKTPHATRICDDNTADKCGIFMNQID